MHQDSILLAAFVVALVAAFLGGMIARMVRLPPVVGYLLGGLAVGPFTPWFYRRLARHEPTRQGGRHVHDVRYRPAFFPSTTSWPSAAWRHRGALLQTALGTLAGCGVGLALG